MVISHCVPFSKFDWDFGVAAALMASRPVICRR